MKFFGDIKSLSGYELPVVDCITGGSPCQDLSVAGKRAGLDGERSGLFMEQIRIVKEMRENDRRTGRTGHLVRPRYMVWENVPGAFSSNGGQDFQAVLTEIVRIADPEAPDVPMSDKGAWSKSGCLYSDMGDWSIAWRVHDAQYWGVPQRRKRIALVADFGGLSAPEICFERTGLSRDPEPRGAAGKEAAGGTGGGTESAGFKGGQSTGGIGYEVEKSPTLSANPSALEPTVYDARGNGDGLIAPTITGDHENRVTDYTAVCVGNGQLNQITMKPISNTLDTMHDQQAVMAKEPILLESNQNHATVQTDGISTALPASAGMGGGYVPMVLPFDTTQITSQVNRSSPHYGDPCHPLQAHAHAPTIVFDKEMYNCGERMQGEPQAREDDAAPTVRADSHPSGVFVRNVVRRMTPLECERLQGYPDGWTDIGEWIDSEGKKHKDADSPRYKALGNSIALPFWFWLLRRISAQYERPATLGSLFDGIGGFPLCWEQCNGRGTALWSSEIEEFPIAVVKRHFGEDEDERARRENQDGHRAHQGV